MCVRGGDCDDEDDEVHALRRTAHQLVAIRIGIGVRVAAVVVVLATATTAISRTAALLALVQ
jgi:hypothetical protein